MASSVAPVDSATCVAPVERERMLVSFRDRLFAGSWGRLEFELRRILDASGGGQEARIARIQEDLTALEHLRRRDIETHRLNGRRAEPSP